jgi:hypothetical protein
MKHNAAKNAFACFARSGNNDNACRRRVHEAEPLLTCQSNLTTATLLKFWAHVANGESTSKIARLECINRNTVTKLFDLLCCACLRHQAVPTFDKSVQTTFNRLSVDETYVGRRKYNKGKRARRRGHWFVTVTEDKNPGVGQTFWYLVKRRDRPTLETIIKKHLIGARTVVATDSHKGYARLDQICRHEAVNHRKEFVSEEGFHTNVSEAVHGIIKSALLEQHSKYGDTSRNLRKNISLQCVKFGDGKKDRLLQWSSRLRNILLAVRGSYKTVPEELETISMSSAPEGDPETDVAVRSLDNTSVRLTSKGLPDKRIVGVPGRKVSHSHTRNSHITVSSDTHEVEEPARKKARKEPSESKSAVGSTLSRKSKKGIRWQHQLEVSPGRGTRTTSAQAQSSPGPRQPFTQALQVSQEPPVIPQDNAHHQEAMQQWIAGGRVRLAGEAALSDLQVALLRWGEAQMVLPGREGADWNELQSRTAAVQNNAWEGDLERVAVSLNPGAMILSPAMKATISKYNLPRFRFVDPEHGHWFINRFGNDEDVDEAGMRKELPRGVTLLWCIQYSQHWVLCVINIDDRRFDCYDSKRTYAHEVRCEQLQRITRLIAKLHHVWIRATLKHSEQQEAGSNDCGVFSIRNALMVAGYPKYQEVTREYIAACWNERAKEIRAAQAKEREKERRKRSVNVSQSSAQSQVLSQRSRSAPSQGLSQRPRLTEADRLRNMLKRR